MWGPYSPGGYPYEEEGAWALQIAGERGVSVLWPQGVSEMTRSGRHVPVDLAASFRGPWGMGGYGHLSRALVDFSKSNFPRICICLADSGPVKAPGGSDVKAAGCLFSYVCSLGRCHVKARLARDLWWVGTFPLLGTYTGIISLLRDSTGLMDMIS